MVARAESVIFLAALCSMVNFVRCLNDGDGATDEDTPLREALLLIKLIRRTGAVSDITREKQSFSKHEAISVPLSPDPPQPLHNVFSYNNTFPADQNNRRSKSDDGRKLHDAQINHKKKHRQEFYRRLDYEDMFDTHPDALSTQATSSAAPSSITPANAAAVASPTPSQLSKTDPVPDSAKVPVKKNNKPKIIEKKSTPDDNDRSSAKTHKLNFVLNERGNEEPEENVQQLLQDDSLKDPVISQVETELKNEMDTVHRPDKKLKFNKNMKAAKAPSTLRIHLEGSTRYPIPLPKNHALCYTDPLNGLCRTPI